MKPGITWFASYKSITRVGPCGNWAVAMVLRPRTVKIPFTSMTAVDEVPVSQRLEIRD